MMVSPTACCKKTPRNTANTSSGAYTRTLRDETSGTDLDQKQWTFIPHLCKGVKMHLKNGWDRPLWLESWRLQPLLHS